MKKDDLAFWNKLYALANVLTIGFSAVFVLYPPVSHSPYFVIPFCLLLMPIIFALTIHRIRTERANLPLRELRARINNGEPLPMETLEIVATILIALAAVRAMTY
jgi:hypothetical protein